MIYNDPLTPPNYSLPVSTLLNYSGDRILMPYIHSEAQQSMGWMFFIYCTKQGQGKKTLL